MDEIIHLERLLQVVKGAFLHRIHRRPNGGVGGDENGGGGRTEGAGFLQNLQTVRAGFVQIQVSDDQFWTLRFHALHGGVEIAEGKNLVTFRRSISASDCTMVTSSSSRRTFCHAGIVINAGAGCKRDCELGVLMTVAGDQVAQLEDGQEHADDNAAHHHPQKHDQQRLDQRGQAVQRRLDFLIQKIGDPLQHVVNLACLFPGGQHADDHDREDRMLGQRGGDALAALDVHRGGFEGVFHDDVADGVLHDAEHFQNRHAAADQGRHGAGEAGEADFVGDNPKMGSLIRLASQKARPTGVRM